VGAGCGCVFEARSAELTRKKGNLYLDLKTRERDLVAEGEKGAKCKLPQTGGRGERAKNYHRMHTTWRMCLAGTNKGEKQLINYG
jgi:hypothetical protein